MSSLASDWYIQRSVSRGVPIEDIIKKDIGSTGYASNGHLSVEGGKDKEVRDMLRQIKQH